MDGAFSFQQSTQLSRLIDEISYLTRRLDPHCHREATASLLRLALPHVSVIAPSEQTANERGYARDLVYADPEERFSVLVLRWLPGATTPIHGHNAWGCVGVISGEIACETYSLRNPDINCENIGYADLLSTGQLLAGPGTVASVEPNPKGIHRLFNPANVPATTLHIYGMDLSGDPCCINIPYEA